MDTGTDRIPSFLKHTQLMDHYYITSFKMFFFFTSHSFSSSAHRISASVTHTALLECMLSAVLSNWVTGEKLWQARRHALMQTPVNKHPQTLTHTTMHPEVLCAWVTHRVNVMDTTGGKLMWEPKCNFNSKKWSNIKQRHGTKKKNKKKQQGFQQ